MIYCFKERNKPIEPPKKPILAPFFLPTTASAQPKFIIPTTTDDDKANDGGASPSSSSAESRVLSLKASNLRTKFALMLEDKDCTHHFILLDVLTCAVECVVW